MIRIFAPKQSNQPRILLDIVVAMLRRMKKQLISQSLSHSLGCPLLRALFLSGIRDAVVNFERANVEAARNDVAP